MLLPAALAQIGVRQVIQGWDQGILGAEGIPPMKAGGKRRLVIPPGAPLACRSCCRIECVASMALPAATGHPCWSP